MGGLEIKRGWEGKTMVITVATNARNCSSIDVRAYVSGTLFPPATLDASGGAWHWEASVDNSAWADLYDAFNVQVTTVVTQARPIDMPAELFSGVPYVRLVASGDESANETFTVILKG
jgi:hypothetical protein